MNYTNFYSKWARFALFNFVLLATLGVLLRYKIVFRLPFVEQKHLLHAHSHFAFAGWVSLALYIAIIYVLQPSEKKLRQFEWILVAQQMSSFGMLFTFPFTGYDTGSIAFSTASIFVSYAFTWLAIKEMLQQNINVIVRKFLITGLLCNVVSSAGTFILAYLMATRNLQQDLYFGSVYFYLHFQYNGWFLFTIVGIFFAALQQLITPANSKDLNRFFYCLLLALIPAWFLSLMWMRIPGWMYYLAVTAAVIQLPALGYLLQFVYRNRYAINSRLKPVVKWFWIIAGTAFALKILMQGLSAIPQLNTYAFGLRSIVIGFLHLVLLCFVSVFIVGWFFQEKLILLNKRAATTAAWIFVSGVLFNEVLLMLQGVRAMQSQPFAIANYFLLAAACIILTGLLLLLIKQKTSKAKA
ncbi:hypothetical protein IQ13_4080 [Lacibacter cauensis]|uniref:Uncharacterized protein n=1 Tax=Lacibacter cauensis TaxID=510947 RepID=A0A562SAP4_9BACT|nr:hypothetical protein [Lacibacter cauensis]TWI78395.1 hypothetical protein IQ13_4080 [Lacibacter cauensis]